MSLWTWLLSLFGLAERPRAVQYNAEYTAALGSEHWREVRRIAIRHYGYRCGHCGRGDRPLDGHHLTYARLGHERPSDILPLCRRCHDAEHGRVPRRRFTARHRRLVGLAVLIASALLCYAVAVALLSGVLGTPLR